METVTNNNSLVGREGRRWPWPPSWRPAESWASVRWLADSGIWSCRYFLSGRLVPAKLVLKLMLTVLSICTKLDIGMVTHVVALINPRLLFNTHSQHLSLTWAPAEGPWSPVTEVTEGPTAPVPGWTTVVAPASAILMTLASSTLFIIEEIGEGTLDQPDNSSTATSRISRSLYWIDQPGKPRGGDHYCTMVTRF